MSSIPRNTTWGPVARLQFRMYSIFRDVTHERMVQIFRRGVLQPHDLFTLVAEAEDRHVRVYDLIQAIVHSYRF